MRIHLLKDNHMSFDFKALALLLQSQLGKPFVNMHVYSVALNHVLYHLLTSYLSHVSQAHPSYCHATSQTGHSTDHLLPFICQMTLTHVFVPIFYTPLPLLKTTNWPPMNGMMWSFIVSSMA